MYLVLYQLCKEQMVHQNNLSVSNTNHIYYFYHDVFYSK